MGDIRRAQIADLGRPRLLHLAGARGAAATVALGLSLCGKLNGKPVALAAQCGADGPSITHPMQWHPPDPAGTGPPAPACIRTMISATA